LNKKQRKKRKPAKTRGEPGGGKKGGKQSGQRRPEIWRERNGGDFAKTFKGRKRGQKKIEKGDRSFGEGQVVEGGLKKWAVKEAKNNRSTKKKKEKLPPAEASQVTEPKSTRAISTVHQEGGKKNGRKEQGFSGVLIQRLT